MLQSRASAAFLRTSGSSLKPPVRIDFTVALGAACIAACGALGMAAGAYWVTRKAPDHSLASPSAAMMERIALRLPGPAPDVTAGRDDIVFLFAKAADGSLAPADRPALLYARFVEAEARPSEGGLIRRRFRAETPFEGEELFLAPPDGRAFWARCLTAEGAGSVKTTCLTEVRLGGSDVEVRFAPALLPRWELLGTAVRERLAR